MPEQKHRFAFVATLLDPRCILPVEIVPTFTLRKANECEVTFARDFLKQASPEFARRNFYEFNWSPPTGQLGGQQKAEVWKFFVITYPRDAERWLSQEPTPYRRFEDACYLAKSGLEWNASGDTPDFYSVGVSSNALAELNFELENHGLDWQHAYPFSEVDVSEIAELFDKLLVVEDEHPDLRRAVSLLHELRVISPFSEFRALALFSIIELIITHEPARSGDDSGITRQIRKKLPLVTRRRTSSNRTA